MGKFLSFLKAHKLRAILLAVVVVIIVVVGIIMANNKGQNQNQEPAAQPKEVGVVSLADSASLKQTIKYPGLVVSDQEVKLISKASGNISQLNFKVGDKVSAEQVLAKIDSVDENPAKASYANALTALNNAILSKQNIANTYDQSYKSAQIAYETAKVATEQARIALENKKTLSGESNSDAGINADVTADSVAGVSSAVLDGINNITGLSSSNSVSVSYSGNLGVLDQQSLITAKNVYTEAAAALQSYQTKTFVSTADKVNAAADLARAVQKLVNSTQVLLKNSITSTALPQTSATGPSLSGLQSAVAGYQSQINGALAQINGAKQSLSNTGLNNNSTLDSLQKAYELAQQQENAAAQNLNNVLAGSKSQVDGAQSQVDALSGQVSLARIQVDNLTVKAPIAGTITQKMVSQGDSVAPGQVIAVMSQTAKLKVQTYVDQVYVNLLQTGMPAIISDNNGHVFKAKVISISPAADSATKRFLVEADFEDETVADLPSPGIIISISFDVLRNTDKPGAIFLPITAVNVGQNDNYIYIYNNGKAQKQLINIVSIDGEIAEISSSSSLPMDTRIITEGNKLIKDGDLVSIVASTQPLNFNN